MLQIGTGTVRGQFYNHESHLDILKEFLESQKFNLYQNHELKNYDIQKILM